MSTCELLNLLIRRICQSDKQNQGVVLSLTVSHSFSLHVAFFSNFIFLNRYFIMVEGFVCPRDPRGYFIRGLFHPGSVSNGKLVHG